MPITTTNGKLAVMELDLDWEPGLPLSPGALGQDDQQQLLWGYPDNPWASGSITLPDPGDVRAGVVYDENNLPDPGDVRLGVVYGELGLEMTGTLEIPAESDVRLGVQYGADGVEYTGTLGASLSTASAHSPADILRWVLVSLNLLSNPADDADWPGYCSSEPDSPDNCVTTYDTTGTDDGRSMTDGEVFHNPGVQVRVRATDHSTGWIKADAVRAAMEQSINQYYIVIGSTRYLVHCVTNVGNVIALGKDTSSTKRSLFTINVALNFSPYPLS